MASEFVRDVAGWDESAPFVLNLLSKATGVEVVEDDMEELRFTLLDDSVVVVNFDIFKAT